MADYSTFGSDPSASSLSSPTGISTGNPIIDMISSMFLSQFLAPKPNPEMGQSTYDAMMSRYRTFQFMDAQKQGFANNLIAKKLGLDKDGGLLGTLGFFASNPNGLVARLLNPLVGGNPMAAQMHLSAHMGGFSMAQYGRSGMLETGESTGLMEGLYKSFYNQREVTAEDVEKNKAQLLKDTEKIYTDNELGANVGLQNLVKEKLGTVGGLKAFTEQYGTAEDALKSEKAYDFIKSYKTALGAKGDVQGWEEVSKDKEVEFGKVISSITSASTRNELTQLFKTVVTDGGKAGVKAGFVDSFAALEKKLKANVGVGGLATVMAAAEKNMLSLGTKLPTSINFASTRGFALEDFAKMFTGAHEYRFVGSGKSMSKTMEDLGKNAPIIYDAARAHFGNDKTVPELTQLLSSYVGKGFVDFTDKKQTAALELNLYKLHSAGTLAQVNASDVQNLHAAYSELGAITPGLERVGGMTWANMTARTLNSTTVAMRAYSPQYMREVLGGPVGYARDYASGVKAAGDSTQVQEFSALYALASAQPGGKAKGVLDEILSSKKGLADLDWSNTAGRVAEALGYGTGTQGLATLRSMMVTSPELSTIGAGMLSAAGKAEDLIDVGTQARVDTTAQALTRVLAGGAGLTATAGDLVLDYAFSSKSKADFFKDKGEDITKLTSDSPLASMFERLEALKGTGNQVLTKQNLIVAASQVAPLDLMQQLGQWTAKDVEHRQLMANPQYAADYKRVTALNNTQAALSQKMAKKYGFTRATMGTQVLQSLLSGDNRDDLIGGMLADLQGSSDPVERKQYEALKKNFKDITDLGSSSGVKVPFRNDTAARVLDVSVDAVTTLAGLTVKEGLTGNQLSALLDPDDTKAVKAIEAEKQAHPFLAGDLEKLKDPRLRAQAAIALSRIDPDKKRGDLVTNVYSGAQSVVLKDNTRIALEGTRAEADKSLATTFSELAENSEAKPIYPELSAIYKDYKIFTPADPTKGTPAVFNSARLEELNKGEDANSKRFKEEIKGIMYASDDPLDPSWDPSWALEPDDTKRQALERVQGEIQANGLDAIERAKAVESTTNEAIAKAKDTDAIMKSVGDFAKTLGPEFINLFKQLNEIGGSIASALQALTSN